MSLIRHFILVTLSATNIIYLRYGKVFWLKGQNELQILTGVLVQYWLDVKSWAIKCKNKYTKKTLSFKKYLAHLTSVTF